MNPASSPLLPRHTLLFLLGPMLATVVGLRLYLHGVRVQHIYPGGYLFHHLFAGILITVPAAFVLAFGTRNRWLAVAVRIALGAGSGLMLDEITYLVMTRATDEDYVSWTSLGGVIVFVSAAAALILGLYRWHETKRRTDREQSASIRPTDLSA